MDYIEQMAAEIAEKVLAQIADKIPAMAGKHLKDVQLVFNEQEAADFLRISKQTLETYRKNGLINYSLLPPGRADLMTRKDGRWNNQIFRYTLADLLNFQAKHKVVRTPEQFEIDGSISVLGAKLEGRRGLRKVG